MFQPSKLLLKNLNADPHNISNIIGALIGYINADPMFKKNDFDNAIRYVLAHGITESELFTDFDSELEFEENSEKWDENYYARAVVRLNNNFCHKRIEHVKAVAKRVYATERARAMKEESESRKQSKVGTSTKKENDQQELNQGGIILLIVIIILVILIVKIL